jgi:hypothetical protein
MTREDKAYKGTGGHGIGRQRADAERLQPQWIWICDFGYASTCWPLFNTREREIYIYSWDPSLFIGMEAGICLCCASLYESDSCNIYV